jgi:hypothetical protein
MLPRHGVGLCRLVLSAGQYGARAPKRHSSTLKPALAVAPSKSDEHAPVPVRPGVRARHFIRSLAPSELTAGDWGDLSLLGDKMVTVDDKASGKQAALRVNYASDGGRPVLFPAGTAGFFYLHMPDSAHPIGAHLRFRLVAAPDPVMFAAGRDLCTPSGAVWARWLPTATRQAGGAELACIAERQGLLPAAAVAHWRAASDVRQLNKAFHLPVCPGIPFWWTLSRTSTTLTLGWGAHYRVITLLPGPFARRRGAKNIAPFEGDTGASRYATEVLTKRPPQVAHS